MKKTLFLSALLGAALCGSAWAADYTVNTSDNGVIYTATAADSITFDLTGHLAQGAKVGKGHIAAPVTITKLELNNGYSDDTFYFEGAVTGSGMFKYTGSNGSNNQTYVFSGDMSNYTGNMEIVSGKQGAFTFAGNTSGTGTITATNSSSEVNVQGATMNNSAITTSHLNISGDSTFTTGTITTSEALAITGGTTTLNSGVTVNATGAVSLAESATLTIDSGAKLNVQANLDLTDAVESNTPTGNGYSTLTFSHETGLLGTVNNNGSLQLDGHNATLNDGTLSYSDSTIKYYIRQNGFGIGDAKWVVSDIGEGNNANLIDGKNLTKLEILSGSMSTNGTLTVTDIDMAAGTVMKNTNLNIKGSGTIRNLQMSGKTLNFYWGGNVAMYDTNTLTNLDIAGSGSDVLNSALTLKAGATLATASNLWIRRNGAKVLLEEDASLTIYGSTTVKGLSSEAGSLASIVRARSGDSNKYDLAHSSIDISNAAVSVAAQAGWYTSVKNKLINSSLTYTNGEALSLYADNTLTSLTLSNGVQLNIETGTTSVASDTTLSSVSVKNGAKLALTGALSVQNLALTGNGTVTATNGITVNGALTGASDASLTAGNAITISGDVSLGGLLENRVDLLADYTGTIRVDGSVNNSRIHLGNNSNKLTKATIKLTNATFNEESGDITGGYITGWNTWAHTFDQKLLLDGGAIKADQNSLWDNVTVADGSSVSYFVASNSGTGLTGLTMNGGTLKLIGGNSTVKFGGDFVFNGGILDLNNKNITKTSNNEAAVNLQVSADSAAKILNGSLTVNTLTLNAGSTITLGEEHENTIFADTLVVAGAGATFNGNLNVSAGGTLDFSASHVLTMGCGVEIGNGVIVVIDGDLVEDIQSGNVATLITNVDAEALTLGQNWVFRDAGGNVIGNGLRLDTVDLGDGKVSIVVAPEPATATLSLLALAGLMARRRRH